MAYDEELASRLRALLNGLDGISERRMFGGLSFLRDGNLVCGVMGETLLVRLGEAQARAALGPSSRAPDGPSETAVERHGLRRPGGMCG